MRENRITPGERRLLIPSTPQGESCASCAVESPPIPELPEPGANIKRVDLSPEQIRQQREHVINLLQHVARAVGAAVALGLSLVALILSGGAGLPVVILTGAALMIAIGDACCAYYNYQQTVEQKPTLQTFNDSVAFVVSELALRCGASWHCANNIGDSVSLLLRAGIGVSTIILPNVTVMHLPGSISAACGMASAVTSSSLTLVGAGLDSCMARNQRREPVMETEEEHAQERDVPEREISTEPLRRRSAQLALLSHTL